MQRNVLMGIMVCLLCFQFSTAVSEIPRALMEVEATETVWTVFEEDIADIPISGTVTDAETGDPIPGVNVLVKGTTSGTITDVAGNFNIDVDQGAILVFSSVGFKSMEVPVRSGSVINVSLQADITALSEIVVVGYGTQEKRDVTAAIGSVDADRIKSIPVGSSIEAIQGQIAGVDVSGARPESSGEDKRPTIYQCIK